MNQKDLISVIVPVYNVKGFLVDCVESILNQSYSNLQIILVDDGSEDGSGELCDQLKLKDNRIEVIHKDNGGLSDARNAGIPYARGRFISFIDSDDLVVNEYFECLLEALLKHNVDMAVCKPYLFVDNPCNLTYYEQCRIISGEQAINAFLRGDFDPMAWGKLYKRDLFRNIRYPKGKNTEDVYVIVELLKECKTVCCGVNTFYCYRQRPNSIQYSGKINTEDIICANKHNSDLLSETKFKKLANEKYLFSYVDAVNMMTRNGVYDERFDLYKTYIFHNLRIMLFASACFNSRKIWTIMLLVIPKLYRKVYQKRYRNFISKLP